MASAQLSSACVLVCALTLILSCAHFPVVSSKHESALGFGNAILQDALGDVEDNDIESLKAEDVRLEVADDDAEAMRLRLLAIDAERDLLRQRLGLKDSKVSKSENDAAVEGVGEIFERLWRELAPLVPALLEELAGLALVGALVYFATKWSVALQKPHVAKTHQASTTWKTAPRATSLAKDLTSRAPWKASGRYASFDGVASAPSMNKCEVIEPPAPQGIPSKQVLDSSEALSIVQKLETQLLRPPPGLGSTNEDTVAPILDMSDVQDIGAELCMPAGPPPGLECLQLPTIPVSSEPTACAIEVARALQEMVAVQDESPEIECSESIADSPELECLEPVADTNHVAGGVTECELSELSSDTKAGDHTDKGLVSAAAVSASEDLASQASTRQCSEPNLDTNSKANKPAQTQSHQKVSATKRNKAAKIISDIKPQVSGVNIAEVELELVSEPMMQPTAAPFSSRIGFVLSSLKPKAFSSVQDEFGEGIDDVSDRKKLDGSTHGIEKLGKRKGKLQQRSSAPKRVSESSPSKRSVHPDRAWQLRWPCSLPLTAAIATMLCIVLAGKSFEPGWTEIKMQEKSLAEKRLKLEQMQLRHSLVSLRLALLQLQEFQEEAAVTIFSLSENDATKLQDAAASARQLHEALQDITSEEFPQVEASFKSVYASWKRTLAEAKRLANPQLGSCLGPEESLPL